MKAKAHWIAALLGAFSSLSLIACHTKHQRAPEPLPIQEAASVPEITSESEEEGVQNLVFKLGDIDRLPNGDQRFTATGTYRGNDVGVEVNLRPEPAGDRFGDKTSYLGVVVMRSLGSRSDSLLRAMDALYETRLSPKRMADETVFSGLSLGGDPTHLRSGAVELKLFFESEDDDRSAELYLNIDVQRSRVVLGEKDPEYRKAIILALTSKGK